MHSRFQTYINEYERHSFFRDQTEILLSFHQYIIFQVTIQWTEFLSLRARTFNGEEALNVTATEITKQRLRKPRNDIARVKTATRTILNVSPPLNINFAASLRSYPAPFCFTSFQQCLSNFPSTLALIQRNLRRLSLSLSLPLARYHFPIHKKPFRFVTIRFLFDLLPPPPATASQDLSPGNSRSSRGKLFDCFQLPRKKLPIRKRDSRSCSNGRARCEPYYAKVSFTRVKRSRC